MSKLKFPTTAAIRFLRDHHVPFEPQEYTYVEHGGTAQAAECLHVAEHAVIKTIVLQNDKNEGIIVLMHGDKHISTRQLARDLGMKHIEPATPQQAHKWTGYFVGGMSPFGIRVSLPICVEATIYELPEIYINGGKRGLLVAMNPNDLKCLQPNMVHVATDI